MRIVLMSDSHGNYFALENVVERNLTADIFVHLGDGERELERIMQKYPMKRFYNVKGNCDFASISPGYLLLGLDYSHKLLAVHGHQYGVKYSLERLKSFAQSSGADILAYGHTHARYIGYENGLYIINPGSVSAPRDGLTPSYGFIDITDAGVVTNIVSI